MTSPAVACRPRLRPAEPLQWIQRMQGHVRHGTHTLTMCQSKGEDKCERAPSNVIKKKLHLKELGKEANHQDCVLKIRGSLKVTSSILHVR